MTEKNVSLVMRGDAIFNFIAGIAAQLYLASLLTLIGWPLTDTRVYAMVLGSALLGLSVGVWLAASHPAQSRDMLIAAVIAKTLAGVTILYEVFIHGQPLPSPWLLPAAVVVQVLFVLGELAYLVKPR